MKKSNFQIVKREDGELEIVQLRRIKKNRKLRPITKEKECPPATVIIKSDRGKPLVTEILARHSPTEPVELAKLEENVESEEKEKSDENQKLPIRITVIKNYSRIRKNRTISTQRENDAATEFITNETVTSIKVEPELIIDDEICEETAYRNEVPKWESAVNQITTAVPTEKIGEATSKANILYNPTPLPAAYPSLSQSVTNTVKCTTCGMIFKSGTHFMDLRIHFLQHKSCTMKLVQKQTGVKYQSIDREKPLNSHTKEQLLLNKKLSDMSTDLKKIPVKIQFGSTIGGTNSDGANAKTMKIINIKPVPRDLLKKLRKLKPTTFKQKIGKEQFVIGNTLIKPINRVNPEEQDVGQYVKYKKATESKRPDGGGTADEDDDVEIIENTPEMIVIEDEDVKTD